jgi:hypothetical protein
MRTLKHLPENEWPEADRQSLRAAYEPGDIFDETAGPGAHLQYCDGLQFPELASALQQPNGPRRQLLLHIAARDTKTKRQDIAREVPDEVARGLRWYRRTCAFMISVGRRRPSWRWTHRR